MIFITVGTHEQQFNRVIQCVDELKGNGLIEGEVVMQTGYSDYRPKYCEYHEMLDYLKMEELYATSDIIITHGGPGSIMGAINHGVKPIVVPRNDQYNEHVDNHQIIFSRFLHEKGKVFLVEEIDDLFELIRSIQEGKLDNKVQENNQNNLENVIKRLNEISNELVK